MAGLVKYLIEVHDSNPLWWKWCGSTIAFVLRVLFGSF